MNIQRRAQALPPAVLPIVASPIVALAIAAILIATFFIAETNAEPPTEPAYIDALQQISERDVRAWIGFLASPELRGRASGEPGYDIASRYVASHLQSWGVQPGAPGGGYYQKFSMLRRARPAGAKLIISRNKQGSDAKGPDSKGFGKNGKIEVIDLANDFHAPGRLRDLEWKAPWVCVGRGDGADRDASDAFHGLAVADSVVLVVPPEGRSSAYRGAVAAGARRIVVVSDVLAKQRSGVDFGRRSRLAYQAEANLLADWSGLGGAEVSFISKKLADRILRTQDTSVAKLREAPRSFAFSGVEIEVSVPFERDEFITQNVVGVIEGSDPELKKEAIVIGAHLDHVGTDGDKIFFGADDNASGSAAILGVAKVLSRMKTKPRRTVIFVFFGAEEIGLRGSQFFVDHPPVPLSRMVFMVNLDMIGRNEEKGDEKAEDNVNSLHLVAASRLSNELEPWIRRVNGRIGFDFEKDEEKNVWNRSDQWSFIKNGVPAVFFFAGFHPDYHKPSDTPSRVNYDKVTRVSRLVLSITCEVADRPQRLLTTRF